MLSATTKNKIIAMLKIKTEDFEAALKDDKEVDVPISETLTALEKAELEARDKNSKKEGKDEGIAQGKEFAIKELKTKAGLTYTDEGSLDPERFIKEYAATIKADPDKRVTALDEQVKLLQKQLSDKDGEVTKFKTAAEQANFDAQLISMFPQRKTPEQGGLSDSEYLTLLKSNLQFDKDGENIVVKKGGEILREESTKNPLPLNLALDSFFNERKWKSETEIPPAGLGGSSSKGGAPGKPAKFSEATAYWEKNEKTPIGSPEFTAYLHGLKKENPAFVNDISF